MGRFEWDGDYEPAEYANAAELFDARARSAIYSRRGRRALAELREALMALPKHELIEGAVCRVKEREYDEEEEPPEPPVLGQVTLAGEVIGAPEAPMPMVVGEVEIVGVCAVGAYLWWQKVKAGADPVKAFTELPNLDSDEEMGDEMFETAWAGQRGGLTYTLAWELASGNDETFQDLSPRDRWQKFVDWIDGVLAAPPLRRGQPAPGKRLGRSWTC